MTACRNILAPALKREHAVSVLAKPGGQKKPRQRGFFIVLGFRLVSLADVAANQLQIGVHFSWGTRAPNRSR